MKTKSLLLLAFTMIGLGACTGPVIMGADAGIIYATKPSDPPPADTKDQIAQHDSWCYATMGDPQCYAHPQDIPPERLINVDPENKYPLDLPSYHEAVVEGQ